MGQSRPSRSKRKTTAPSSRSVSPRSSAASPDPVRDARPVRSPRLRLVTADQAEPIRWNKVMTAQARIAVGYYERPDVLESLADAVLSELDEH